MVDRDQTNMKLEKKDTFGGSGGPQGAILGWNHGPVTKIIENLDF